MKTHVLGSVIPPPNRAIHEIVWKDVVQPDMLQTTNNDAEKV
jgi:hypothetical protein